MLPVDRISRLGILTVDGYRTYTVDLRVKKYVTTDCIMLWVGANINCRRYEHGGQATATWARKVTQEARVLLQTSCQGELYAFRHLKWLLASQKIHQAFWLRGVKHPVVFSCSGMEPRFTDRTDAGVVQMSLIFRGDMPVVFSYQYNIYI